MKIFLRFSHVILANIVFFTFVCSASDEEETHHHANALVNVTQNDAATLESYMINDTAGSFAPSQALTPALVDSVRKRFKHKKTPEDQAAPEAFDAQAQNTQKEALVAPHVVPTSRSGSEPSDLTKSGEQKNTPPPDQKTDDVAPQKNDISKIASLDEATSLVFDGKEIRLNASLPITGSMGIVGRDYLIGLNLIFDRCNQKGGIQKKYPLKYTTLDDQYDSTKAKANILKGLSTSPFFIGNFGSHVLATLRTLVEQKHLLMLFPTAGDTQLRNPTYDYVIHFRPSIEKEVSALIKYAINDQHRKKIAVFYEENQWGRSGLAAVEKIIKSMGLELCAKSYYQANTINVGSAVQEIVKSKPEAIICISTYRPTYNFIQMVLNEGFQHCLFLGLGPATPMQKLIKKSRGVTMAMSSVVPDPFRSKLPLVEKYRQDMAQKFPFRELSQYSLEGYIVGSLFVAALKAQEWPCTAGTLINFFQSLHSKEFGGLKINFNPETRELSSRIWINKGTDTEWDDSFSE